MIGIKAPYPLPPPPYPPKGPKLEVSKLNRRNLPDILEPCTSVTKIWRASGLMSKCWGSSLQETNPPQRFCVICEGVVL